MRFNVAHGRGIVLEGNAVRFLDEFEAGVDPLAVQRLDDGLLDGRRRVGRAVEQRLAIECDVRVVVGTRHPPRS